MQNLLVLSDSDRQMIADLKAEVKRMTELKIPDVLVSGREAARLMGVTSNTISAWVRQKKLTKRTIGGATGIPLSDLMRLKTRREA